MTNQVDPFNTYDLFNKLSTSCLKEWDAYCHHEFVMRIADGSLPQE